MEKYKLITWNPKYQFFQNNDYLYYHFNTNINNENLLENDYKRIDISNVKITTIKKLPSQLEYLKLPNDYDFEISLPENLLALFFGKSFNKMIAYPQKIYYIKYGNDFNQPIDNLSQSLEFLILGNSFNQCVDFLSENLKFLNIGCGFNHSINDLPIGIESLHMYDYSGNLDNLPNGLVEFINRDNNEFNDIHIEITLKDILKISHPYYKNNRKQIYLEKQKYLKKQKNGFTKSNPKTIEIHKLHDNIKFMYLGDTHTYKIKNFPKNIEYLKISCRDKFIIDILYDLQKLCILVLNLNFSNILSNENILSKFRNNFTQLSIMVPYYDVDDLPSRVKIYGVKIIQINNFTNSVKNLIKNIVNFDSQ